MLSSGPNKNPVTIKKDSFVRVNTLLIKKKINFYMFKKIIKCLCSWGISIFVTSYLMSSERGFLKVVLSSTCKDVSNSNNSNNCSNSLGISPKNTLCTGLDFVVWNSFHQVCFLHGGLGDNRLQSLLSLKTLPHSESLLKMKLIYRSILKSCFRSWA